MLTNCNLKWNTGYLVLDGNALTEAILDNSLISIYVPGLIFNVQTGCLTLVFPGGHLKAEFVIILLIMAKMELRLSGRGTLR